MRRAIALAAVLFARATFAQAPVDPSQIEHRLHTIEPGGVRSDTEYQLRDRMRLYHVPGVSIAIIDRSRVVFARGYGVTEFGGTHPVDSTTLFLAGSISKPVFASGVLALVQQGKLSLDEDINRRLTSWHLPDSRFTGTEKVTLRRLLTHSAGLTVHGFPGYAIDQPIPTIPQVLDGQPPANTEAVRNDTTPGARFNYSGGGITIAQLLATDVTHESFPALMRRLVLRPAGMVRSTYENPLPKERWAEAASGHEKIDTPVPGRWHVYPEMAAAGLWTTPADLARWAIALSDAYSGKSQRLLSTATAKQMVSHQVDVQPSCRAGWGLGVDVDDEGGAVHFSHGGRDEGFVASMDMWPTRGVGLVVLTNGVSGDLLEEIQDAFRQAYGLNPPADMHAAVAVESRVLDQYVGRYLLGPKRYVVVTREGGALFALISGQPRVEMVASSERAFHAKRGDAQLTFESDGAGRVTGVVLDQNGCTPRAPRLGDDEARRIGDAEASFAVRFKAQTAAPGSEAALRRVFDELRAGKPNYDLMSAELAQVTRQQLTQLELNFVVLGALRSISFTGVGPGGADIYRCKFANGTQDWRIWLTDDGRVETLNYRPVTPP